MQHNNDDADSNTSNQDRLLRFHPKSYEQTPELQQLFDRIDDQIDLFLSNESNSIPRAQLSRLVAGHLCKDDVEELQTAFKAFSIRQPKKATTKVLNSWNKYVSVKSNGSTDLGGTGLFAGSTRLSLEWGSMTSEEKDVYKRMDIAPKARGKKRKINNDDDIDEMTIKSYQYRDALKGFEDLMAAMLDNFGTHVVLMAVTDTRSNHLFPPYMGQNSGK